MQLKRILVPLAGTSVDPEVIRVAVVLGKPAKAQIVAIHVIEVRWNLPLDAILEPESERGETVLEAAVKVAEQAGAHIETELVQAREAAAAIIDTARDLCRHEIPVVALGQGEDGVGLVDTSRAQDLESGPVAEQRRTTKVLR